MKNNLTYIIIYLLLILLSSCSFSSDNQQSSEDTKNNKTLEDNNSENIKKDSYDTIWNIQTNWEAVLPWKESTWSLDWNFNN